MILLSSVKIFLYPMLLF